MNRRSIVMVGTAREGAGGIASVIAAYAAYGLFSRWPVITLESHVLGSKWRKLCSFAIALTRYLLLLARRRIALLHLQTSSGPSFWRKSCFALPAFLMRVPVITHIHSGRFTSFYEDCGVVRRGLIRFVLERSALVVALSPTWRGRILEIAPKSTVVSLPNPVVAEAGPPRQLTRRSAVFLGKISVEKGVIDLVQAWQRVRESLADSQLIIAGAGERMAVEAVRERIAALGLNGFVTLPGWVVGEAKSVLLAESAVCVLPSYHEGMPMSLLEALGAGVPCVASTVGGIPDMIADGIEGRLVAPGDVPALAAALIDVLSDNARYAAMSEAALKRFTAEFAADVVMPKLESLYSALGAEPIAVKLV
jgi:glycosyltransferase involved in cell wall biosynthesis